MNGAIVHLLRDRPDDEGWTLGVARIGGCAAVAAILIALATLPPHAPGAGSPGHAAAQGPRP